MFWFGILSVMRAGEGEVRVGWADAVVATSDLDLRILWIFCLDVRTWFGLSR